MRRKQQWAFVLVVGKSATPESHSISLPSASRRGEAVPPSQGVAENAEQRGQRQKGRKQRGRLEDGRRTAAERTAAERTDGRREDGRGEDNCREGGSREGGCRANVGDRKVRGGKGSGGEGGSREGGKAGLGVARPGRRRRSSGKVVIQEGLHSHPTGSDSGWVRRATRVVTNSYQATKLPSYQATKQLWLQASGKRPNR